MYAPFYQSSKGEAISLKRQDYYRYFRALKDILEKYIQAHEDCKAASWYNEAHTYLNGDFAYLAKNHPVSLIELKHSVTHFCESLRSTYNRCATTVFSEASIRVLGDLVGSGKGSQLKEDLLRVCDDIKPYDAKYILDSIYVRLLMEEDKQSIIDPCSLLTEEESLILKTVLNDQDMEKAFIESGIRHERNCIFRYNTVSIIKSFRNADKNAEEESIKLRALI